MAQIDSIDNLITEFEKVAPTIEQLFNMAVEAAELKEKLLSVHADATKKLAEIEGKQQRLNQNLTDIGSLKQDLKSRIDATRTLETNVSKALIGLKNDLTGKVDAAKKNLDAEVIVFSQATKKLLADKASLADQAIEDLKTAKAQGLDDLKTSLETALRNFNAKSAPMLIDITARLQQLDGDKKSAMSAFQASVDTAIAALPSKFDHLKIQLAQAMQVYVANELQQFLARQNTLVDNLNQRIDALENLARTQQETARAQLDGALSRLQRLEEAFEKKGSGFLGLFRS